MTNFPILVTRRSGALDLLSPTGSGWEATTIAPQGRWPAWNPRRDIVAYSTVRLDREPRSTIELASIYGGHIKTVFESQPGIAPVIAPRVPHYINWSPGGDILSFVANGQFGLTFHLSDIDGLLQSDPILNGAPIFHAWCIDNNFVAVHAGSELAVVESAGSRVTADISGGAVGFRTPAYSDDHASLAYALPGEPGVVIMVAIFQGTASREVARFSGGVALAFRPGTNQLSICVTHNPTSGTFDELWLLDLAESQTLPVKIAKGPFVACIWSPTGEHVALAIPLQTGDGRYQVVVRDAAGAFGAASAAFVPSLDVRVALGFFDQYALSHHIWAPDGQSMVICGREPGDAVSAAFGETAGDYVFLWRPFERRPIELITAGEFAVFQPLAKTLFD